METQLTAVVREVLTRELGVPETTFSLAWKQPEDADHGDLATPIALQVAKEIGRSPKNIALALVKRIREIDGVERAEVAGAGYVNVWLQPGALVACLADTSAACTARPTRKEAPFIVDYSGPNIAKPLGIHHILSTVIGQAIVNIERHSGSNVIGWSYPGDWGTQFGKLAVAYTRWGDGRPASAYSLDELLALYVRFHAEAEGNPSLEEEGRAAFAALETGDASLRRFWKDVVAVTKEALGVLYERLSVTLDVETGESFYEEKMEPVLKEGIKKGVFVKGEKGALIVEYPKEQDLPPCMVRKSDGSTLYATRDLAMLRYRIDEYHPRAIAYVVDVAQSLHFKQLFAAVALLGWDVPHLEHVVFGRMRFQDAAMSTRKGTVLKLEEVLDEAVLRARRVIEDHGAEVQTDDPDALAEMMGVGAVIYGVLSQNRKKDMVFDWDTALSLDGNSAPYLQYTHARARSVLRKAEVQDAPLPKAVTELSVQERALVNALRRFPAVLREARTTRMPHLLTQELFALGQTFNAFYNVEPILKAPAAKRRLRLFLTSLVASVLRTGTALLCIRVPERM